MKWSSNSGSLLSLSQWLHTHSCSVPSPCCPLSAGLGSPSLRKSCGRESPMRKCLKSWTEGKSILYRNKQRKGGLGGGGRWWRWGDGMEGYEKMHSGILGCNLWSVFLLLTAPPHLSLNLLNGGCRPGGLGVRESRAVRLCVFVSASGTASDAAHRSRTGLLSVQ